MQSALVRKDAVMLHDPMRTHSRAVTVGVIASCLGLLGFVVYGMIDKSPSAPTTGIVISKQTGAVYVALDQPRQIIPVPNLASARLLLMQSSSANGSGQGTSAPASNGPAGGTPTVVDDSALQGIPRGRLTGIPGAPGFLPETTDQLISPNWAVCDNAQPSDQVNLVGAATPETTVLAGVAQLPGVTKLDAQQSLLVQGPDRRDYLIYAPPQGQSIPNATAVRAVVNPADPAVAATFKLRDLTPRKVSAALLNAIPEVRPLAIPAIDGKGGKPDYEVGFIPKIGSAVQSSDGTSYYLVLQDGLQRVSPAVAKLVQATSTNVGMPQLRNIDETNAPQTRHPLPLDDFPTDVPTPLDATANPVACLSWTASNGDAHTDVLVGSQVPVPQGMQAVQLNQPGADGQQVKWFYLPPGHAAVVHSSTSKADFRSGPIYLVSDTGAKYGIADPATASALGLAMNGPDYDPAPDAILRLLPAGPSLNHTDATRTFDTVSVAKGDGVLPSPSASPGN